MHKVAHTSLQHQPFLLRPFSSPIPLGFYVKKTLLQTCCTATLLMTRNKVHRSFARFVANVACMFFSALLVTELITL